MKHASKFFCFLMTAAAMLQAVGEDCVPGYRASYPEQAYGISNLTISPKTCRKGRLSFSDTNILFNPSIFKNSEIETCFLIGIRDVWLKLSNDLHAKNTPYGVLGLNCTYDGIPEWMWTGSISLQAAANHCSFSNNTRYIGSIIGRYAIRKSLGISLGTYTELGFRASIVRPVIGLDYTKGNWVIDAIYPIKAGVIYKRFSKHLFSVMARPFYTALREERSLWKSPAIATFSGSGLEFRYDFLMKKGWNVWIALGHMLHSSLSLGDRHNHHRQHIHLHSAPYTNLGIMIDL